jgi:N-acyl-D-aspartate/D-glutamate deacylase
MRAQVGTRPIGVLFGLQGTIDPLRIFPGYAELAELPIDERVAELRRPEVRERILADEPDPGFSAFLQGAMQRTFELSDPPDYEPAPEQAIARRAEALGVTTWELMYDLLLVDDGHAMLTTRSRTTRGDLAPARRCCSTPTPSGPQRRRGPCRHDLRRQLPHLPPDPLVRDRERGPRIDLAEAVRLQTAPRGRRAGRRGVVAPGYRADLNLVDLDALAISPPAFHDLPTAEAARAAATGYRHPCRRHRDMTDGTWTGPPRRPRPNRADHLTRRCRAERELAGWAPESGRPPRKVARSSDGCRGG